MHSRQYTQFSLIQEYRSAALSAAPEIHPKDQDQFNTPPSIYCSHCNSTAVLLKSGLCLDCGHLNHHDHSAQYHNQSAKNPPGQLVTQEQQSPIIKTTIKPASVTTHCSYCNSAAVMPKSGLCLNCGKIAAFDNRHGAPSDDEISRQTAIEITLVEAGTTAPLPRDSVNTSVPVEAQATPELIDEPVPVEHGHEAHYAEEPQIAPTVEQVVSTPEEKPAIDKALDATAFRTIKVTIKCSDDRDSGLAKPPEPENPFLQHKTSSTKSDVIEFCEGVFDRLKEKLFPDKSQHKPLNRLPTCSLVEENISMEVVQNLFPIRNYDNEKLLAFTSDLKSEVFPKQTALFHVGDLTDSAFYLLKGAISLRDENGKISELISGTEKAKFPLSSGAVHTQTAITKTDVSVLRVSQRIMSRKYAPLSPFSTLVIPNELTKNHLMSSFFHHYNNEELSILSLPDVAVKLRNAMQNDAGISEIAAIIQLDPVISAKLIGLANCPLYVSAGPVKTCMEAVNRIGLNATRNFVISLSLRRIFKNNSALIRKYAGKIWKQSIAISRLSYILATVSQQVDPQKALLAGLICDIGAIPFLSFADNLPKDYCTESDIELILPYVKGPIGHKILSDWGFSEEFLKIPIDSENWRQNSSEELNLTDIVVLARLHSRFGRLNRPRLPTIDAIPAADKFKKLSLSPKLSLYLLHKAKQQVNDAMKAFSSH